MELSRESSCWGWVSRLRYMNLDERMDLPFPECLVWLYGYIVDISAAMSRCGPEMQGWFVALISSLVVPVVPGHWAQLAI